MSTDTNTAVLDIAPLTVIVSESLDPRVRRKMEAEQQGEIKTYLEMSRDMEMRDDLNKIKQDVNKDGKDNDPFKTPESVEEKVADAPPTTPDPAPAPAATPTPAADPAPAPAAAEPANTTPPAPAPAAAAPADEDLESAFESHGTKLPKDLISRVLKNYIKLESGDHDIGSLDHIKTFVYVDLGQTNVSGDTLESVQSLRDPENTIVVIKEDGSPDADTTLRARKIAETLSNRGVKVFGDLDSAMGYLNDLFDVVSGRTKGDK